MEVISYRAERNQTITEPTRTDPNGETNEGTIVTSHVETATVRVDGRAAHATFQSTSSVSTTTHRTFTKQCEYKKHVFDKLHEHHGESRQVATVSASGNVSLVWLPRRTGHKSSASRRPALDGNAHGQRKETQIGCQGRGQTPPQSDRRQVRHCRFLPLATQI
jgi:hypothetical protein